MSASAACAKAEFSKKRFQPLKEAAPLCHCYTANFLYNVAVALFIYFYSVAFLAAHLKPHFEKML